MSVSARGLAALAGPDADLVVDLGGMEFVGAAKVGVNIRAREYLRLRAQSLTLRSPSTSVQRVPDLCGLDDHVDHHPVDAAQMTGSVRSLALADDGVDSTLAPSACRASG